MPNNHINQIIRAVIRLTLENIGEQPVSGWSQWEDLGGGTITSGAAVASTAPNRLEVFARGENNQLLFRTWNGSRWSGWQSLGGRLTSEPAEVSWGGNRLDVFARGQNNHLWHIWRT